MESRKVLRGGFGKPTAGIGEDLPVVAERLAAKQDGKFCGKVRHGDEDVANLHAYFQMVDAQRQPRVEMAHAQLQRPQQQRVQAPSDQLRLGAADAQVIFVRVWVQRSPLLVRHAVVRQTQPPGTYDVRRCGFEGIDDLRWTQIPSN